MTLETQVADLATQTTALLSAVNVQKSFLDNAVSTTTIKSQAAVDAVALIDGKVKAYEDYRTKAIALIDADTAAVDTSKNTAVTVTIPAAIAVVDASKVSANAAIVAKVAAVDNTTAMALNTMRAAYYGALPVAPTLRPDGSARQTGDRYYDITAGAEKTWNGTLWYVPNIDSAALATGGGAAKIGTAIQDSTVESVLYGLYQGRVEGVSNLRNTAKAIFLQKSSKSLFSIAIYGDSVGHKVGQYIVQDFRKYFGNGGNVYPITDANVQGNLGMTKTAGVSHSLDPNLSSTADYQYLPNGGHFIMGNGQEVIFTDNNHSNYSRVVAWFAKRPGDGSALVEVVKAADNSILFSTVVALNGANGTLAEANFPALDITIPFFFRVKSSGAVCLLTAGFLRASGVAQFSMSRGSTTVTNQNASNMEITAGILASINATLMIHEDKEENATVSYPIMMARMVAMPSVDQIFLGSAPNSGSASDQISIRTLLRKQSLANGFSFFDGYTALKDFTEVTRLGWQGDGTHLDNAAYFFIAQQILSNIKINIFGPIIESQIVRTDSYEISRNDGYGTSVVFAKWAGSSVPAYADIANIRRLYIGGDFGGASYFSAYSNYAISVTSSGGGVATLNNLSVLVFGLDHESNAIAIIPDRNNNRINFGYGAYGAGLIRPKLSCSGLNIEGVDIIRQRDSGWVAGTGTPNKAAFAADTATALQIAQRLLAIEQLLRLHNLIN